MTAGQEIGKIIGGLIANQSSTNEQLSSDDSSGSISAFNAELVKASGVITGNSKTWDTTALVWDHPINGDLDTFYWDADYDNSEVILATKQL
jgi:hypothetical protein